MVLIVGPRWTGSILMDVGLRGSSDGIAAAATLRSMPALPGIPIVFVTGHSDPGTLDRIFARFPGTEVIVKPVSAAELHQAIARTCS